MCGLEDELSGGRTGPCGWCLPLPVASSGAAGVLRALWSDTVHARALVAACIPEAATLYAAGVLLWRTLPVYAPFTHCITAVCWLWVEGRCSKLTPTRVCVCVLVGWEGFILLKAASVALG